MMAEAVRRILILGANRGIGFGLAGRFYEKGYEVYGSYRAPTAMDQSVKALKNLLGADRCFEVDLLDQGTIDKAAAAFGHQTPLDVLVNCAGVYELWDEKPLTELSADDLVHHFRVNTVGPFLTTKAFLPVLSRSSQGKIINISSDFASIADNAGGNACYRISKAALNQLTKNTAVDLAKLGNHVISLAVHPGWLATKMTGFYGEDDWETCQAGLVDTIERFGTDEGRGIENGSYVKWDGTKMDY